MYRFHSASYSHLQLLIRPRFFPSPAQDYILPRSFILSAAKVSRIFDACRPAPKPCYSILPAKCLCQNWQFLYRPDIFISRCLSTRKLEWNKQKMSLSHPPWLSLPLNDLLLHYANIMTDRSRWTKWISRVYSGQINEKCTWFYDTLS